VWLAERLDEAEVGISADGDVWTPRNPWPAAMWLAAAEAAVTKEAS